jgi:hypothetical protein
MVLPTTPFLRVKNSSGELATIKIHALKVLDAIFRKKLRSSVVYHHTVGLPVVRPLRPPDKFSITRHFLFPKTMAFCPFYGICFLFFS